jgi:hypothetical protein
MEILIKDKVYFLKSVNLKAQGKIIFLAFRQEAKYIMSSNLEVHNNYQNILLILFFDSSKVAERHYRILKDNFSNDTLSIDVIGENHLEFIGGIDYDLKVKS